jgi:hypothetical protein
MQLNHMRGLGDLVEWLLGPIVRARAGACGCQHRRELLNKMFPFRFRRRASRDELARRT